MQTKLKQFVVRTSNVGWVTSWRLMGRSMARAITVSAALWIGVNTAWAGRSCDTEPLELSAVTQGLGLAERTVKRLN